MLLIVNPHASRVTARRREQVEEVLGAHHELTVVETARRDHATELAASAVADGAECIAVFGGDGTLNEAVGGMVGSSCALMCLPGGGTNVFARTLGLPDDPAAAARILVASLEAGSVRRIGLGSVDGRSFTFHTGIGWDAALVNVVERHARWKRRFGHALFVYAGLRTFFGGYDRSAPHFTMEIPSSGQADAEEIGNGYFAVVMNSDPYTFVHTRPFTVAPGTSLDGPFTVVVLQSMAVRHFLPLLVDALRDRRGVRPRPWLQIRTDVEALTVRRIRRPDGGATLSYQVDGDDLGPTDELAFRWMPEQLDVVMPPQD